MSEIYWMIICGALFVLVVILFCTIYVLEVKLKRRKKDLNTANGIISDILDVTDKCEISLGVCMCGDSMDAHSSPYDCGHTATDEGAYHFASVSQRARRWLDRNY